MLTISYGANDGGPVTSVNDEELVTPLMIGWEPIASAGAMPVGVVLSPLTTPSSTCPPGPPGVKGRFASPGAVGTTIFRVMFEELLTAKMLMLESGVSVAGFEPVTIPTRVASAGFELAT